MPNLKLRMENIVLSNQSTELNTYFCYKILIFRTAEPLILTGSYKHFFIILNSTVLGFYHYGNIFVN
jgi:hypothetical protein